MIELKFEELNTVNGGFSGLGPNLPPLPQEYVCSNLERFLNDRHLTMWDAAGDIITPSSDPQF